MSNYSTYDLSQKPPLVSVPRNYNAAADFVDRRIDEGQANKVAFIDGGGAHTYGELQVNVNRFGNALRHIGLRNEERVMLLLVDSVNFPITFFGAIKAGMVPVPVNTLLTADDYDYMLRDSRARALVVSAELLPIVSPILSQIPNLDHIIVTGNGDAGHYRKLDLMLKDASHNLDTANTTSDDVAF